VFNVISALSYFSDNPIQHTYGIQTFSQGFEVKSPPYFSLCKALLGKQLNHVRSVDAQAVTFSDDPFYSIGTLFMRACLAASKHPVYDPSHKKRAILNNTNGRKSYLRLVDLSTRV
jgi:hypothetical protein